MHLRFFAALAVLGPLALSGRGADQEIHEYRWPGSDKPGELIYPVRHILWIPPGLKTVRAIIVHQHGCGEGACKGGATAAYDLHWRELARRNDCALLGPTYSQKDADDCRKWCDPRNGSGAVFLKALSELAKSSGHPEIATAPWCLWGHSGGGFWSSILMAEHPGRVVAVWCRSGTAFPAWIKGQIPKLEVPKATYEIPLVLNPGFLEKADKRFAGAWTGSVEMFEAYRKEGAPALFAPDPRTGHECGDSRYLAIPWFEACLKARLSGAKDANENLLTTIDQKQGFLVGDDKRPVLASRFAGDASKAGWIPNEAVAKAFVDYEISGTVADLSAPAAPTDLKAQSVNGEIELTWNATADPESGLRGFVIVRDGQRIAQIPENPVARFGRPLFQGLSYHDTPEASLPAMRYVDKNAPKTANATAGGATYKVIAVNGAGLFSQPAVSQPALSPTDQKEAKR